MAVLVRYTKSKIPQRSGRVSLHPEQSGLEEKAGTLRNQAGLLRKEAPDIPAIHELVQRRKLFESQLSSLTRQAMTALEALSPEGE